MDIIAKNFLDVAIKHNKMTLYHPQDAIKVIKKCQQLNKRVYGIDAFKLNEPYIQPFMEFSTDYSDDYSDAIYTNAIEHIQKHSDKGFVFEIVYEGY
jgi:hypothetical protein